MLKRILFFIPVFVLSACLEESSDKIDKKAFTRIYDNSEFYSSFYTLDMQQTSEGGYLIYGGKTTVMKEAGENPNVNTPLTIYFLKVDALGNIEHQFDFEDQNGLMGLYTYPIGKLNKVGDSFYFFCMDATKNAVLININELGDFAQVIDLSTDIPLPLASGTDNSGGLLLQGYDNGTQESVVAQIGIDGQVGATGRYYTGAESPIDNLVMRHANREGTQFPFAVGQTSDNTFYFNGFINYTFSLVFTDDLAATNPGGVVNGQQENAGFSMVLPISQETFAASTYSFGFNFLLPNITLDTEDPASSVTDVHASGYSFPELESNARVKAIRGVLKGKNVVIFASNTKSGQIGLYVYDETTGEFLSSKYVGYSNPFEVGALVQTPEGDLVISGTTYIAGRLPRFCLIKVPKNEIKG